MRRQCLIAARIIVSSPQKNGASPKACAADIRRYFKSGTAARRTAILALIACARSNHDGSAHGARRCVGLQREDAISRLGLIDDLSFPGFGERAFVIRGNLCRLAFDVSLFERLTRTPWFLISVQVDTLGISERNLSASHRKI